MRIGRPLRIIEVEPEPVETPIEEPAPPSPVPDRRAVGPGAVSAQGHASDRGRPLPPR